MTGKTGTAERLGRLDGDALGQDRVDGKAQIRMLLRRADREHGAVVASHMIASTCIQFISQCA